MTTRHIAAMLTRAAHTLVVPRITLADDSWLDFEPAWLSADEAARCLAAVRAEVTWVEREIVLYGKRIMQPRLVGWAGNVAYRYSGQTLEPRPFTDTVRALTERVNTFAGTRFNHVLLNRYRDGRDNMGLHADAEPELGPDPVVATLSLGATRRMTLVPRRPRDGERRSLELPSGSLLVMRGACQRRFRHGIPREPRVTEERVSVTLRRITGVAGESGR
jgi:alkylated DNA repair dioxygenase AlkB